LVSGISLFFQPSPWLAFTRAKLPLRCATSEETLPRQRMEVSMPQLPENPNFEHLKKQAKDLLRLYQADSPEAFIEA